MESEAKSIDVEFVQGLDWNALERAEALKNEFFWFWMICLTKLPQAKSS